MQNREISRSIFYKKIDLEVQFFYYPEERQTREDQGSPEEYEITSILVKGSETDISAIFSDDQFDDIIDLLKEPY